MWHHCLPQRPSCLTSPIRPQWRRWSTVFLAWASAQVTAFHRPGKSVSSSLEHLHVVAFQNIVQNNVYFVFILFKSLAWWPHQMSETIDPECTPLLFNNLEYFEVEVVKVLAAWVFLHVCPWLTLPNKSIFFRVFQLKSSAMLLVTISVHMVLCAKAHRCRATKASLRQQKGHTILMKVMGGMCHNTMHHTLLHQSAYDDSIHCRKRL